MKTKDKYGPKKPRYPKSSDSDTSYVECLYCSIDTGIPNQTKDVDHVNNGLTVLMLVRTITTKNPIIL